MKKKHYLLHGILNPISVPVAFVASFLLMLLVTKIKSTSLFDFLWCLVAVLPLLLSCASCLWGIVRGIAHRKEDKKAIACLVLSLIGFAISLALILFLIFTIVSFGLIILALWADYEVTKAPADIQP